jgi:adenylosuccinate lyase
MRAHGIPDGYERLKHFTRGQPIDAISMRDFIGSLELPVAAKQRLLQLTPSGYIGLAAELARGVAGSLPAHGECKT